MASRHSGWSQIHTQQPIHDDHFLLPCAIHLSTSECSWMLFQLFCTLSEDSEAGCYVYILPCQNYQKQHGLFSCSNVWNHERKRQGVHVFFFFFNKALVVWDDVSEETTHMISFHLSCTPWGCEGGKEWEGIWFSTKIRSIFMHRLILVLLFRSVNP